MDESVRLHTILEADSRPSLVLDLYSDPHPGRIVPFYTNAAFKSHGSLQQFLTATDAEHIAFQTWVAGAPSGNSDLSFSGSSDGTRVGPENSEWFAYTIQKRWRVIQSTSTSTLKSDIAVAYPTPPEDACYELAPVMDHVEGHKHTRQFVMDFFGLSSDAVKGTKGLDALLDHIGQFNWAATTLGPIAQWPPELRQPIHIILMNPNPYALFLGPDHILFYNAAYAEFGGARHPSMMGKSLFEAWPEANDLNRSTFAYIDRTGCPFRMSDFSICLDRNGYMEELHLEWITSPLLGRVKGYLCFATENTQKKIAGRRAASNDSLRQACAGAPDITSLWSQVVRSLAANEADFPLGFVYSRADGYRTYRLEGILGVENGSALPDTINLENNTGGFVSAFRQLEKMFNPIRVTEAEGTLPTQIIDASKSRGFGDRCVEAVACPIRRADNNEMLGFVVLGLPTRKLADSTDEAFYAQLVKTMSDLATRTTLDLEQERLAKEAAQNKASEHATLIQALASSTSEASIMSSKLQRVFKVVEMVDVGICDFSPDGKLIQANEAYFKLSGHAREADAPEFSWVNCVHPADLEYAFQGWSVIQGGGSINYEVRLLKPRAPDDDPNKPQGFRWISTSFSPVLDPDTGKITSISGCLTDITASKQSQEDAIKRAEALERARASEQRFLRFAELAVCPIFIYNDQHRLTFCNTAYFELAGVKQSADYESIGWENLVVDEDLPTVMEKWNFATENRTPFNVEARLKKTWRGVDGEEGYTWFVASAYPEVTEEGEIKAWVGVGFDVSHIKWAEKVQRDRMNEAFEAKRQQENFIDMTSHEIRNPLGAVVHCADSILSSLTDMEALLRHDETTIPTVPRKQLQDIYESSIDAVNTIISCSTHQKRIVDDVLTWSKLNSHLLKITPSPVSTRAIITDIRNMFEIDAQKVGVQLNVQQDISVSQIEEEFVMLDSGRLMQILINLVTNAIKFTREESRRKVTVKIGVTYSKPTLDQLPVDFVPLKEDRVCSVSDSEWGDGKIAYLYAAVEDSGCGLTPEEKKKIFARFSQGSPRTHTRYGGSGLGLFISRELVELQCGEIGFASEAGVGSTFAFFITARTANPPASSLTASRAMSLPFRRRSISNPQITYCILIVEDNIVNQAVLSKQLRKSGHEVYVANHGVEALDFLRKTNWWSHDPPMDSAHMDIDDRKTSIGFPPWARSIDTNSSKNPTRSNSVVSIKKINLDVVLMDVEMPVMDGITCAARIRTLQRQGCIEGHLPVIAVSANARSEQVGQALECGMDDAISKPFRIVDLIPKLERLVGEGR